MSDAFPPAQQACRDEIVRVGASLFLRGYAHSTAGNISLRLDASQGGGFLITPTDACLGHLRPEALAWVGEDGHQRGGERAGRHPGLARALLLEQHRLFRKQTDICGLCIDMHFGKSWHNRHTGQNSCQG